MATAGDHDGPHSLGALLDAILPSGDEPRVSLRDIMQRVGARSFPAVILVPAVLLVSPLSGIPGTPTLGALVVLLCAAQGLLGRDHLWLPDILMRRSVRSERLRRGVDWLRRPAGWMDRHSRGRLLALTSGPMHSLAFVVAMVIAATWPLLELLPFVTSFGAGAVAMIMFGLMTRDGAYLLAGYIQGTAIYATLLTIWAGLV